MKNNTSTCSLSAHVSLKYQLASKPHHVLKKFKASQVACLMELPVYVELKAENADAAARVAAVAASMGIPEEFPG